MASTEPITRCAPIMGIELHREGGTVYLPERMDYYYKTAILYAFSAYGFLIDTETRRETPHMTFGAFADLIEGADVYDPSSERLADLLRALRYVDRDLRAGFYGHFTY